MLKPKAIWVPSATFLAASCHVAWGGLIVLGVTLYLGLWQAWIALLIWSIPKEFLIDPWLERDSYVGGFVDFLWYIAGGTLGSLIWLELLLTERG